MQDDESLDDLPLEDLLLEDFDDLDGDDPDDPGRPHVVLSWDVAKRVASGELTGEFPEDFFGPGFAPSFATDRLPGSEGKIQVMAQRYASRQQLFHPRDAR